MNLLRRRPVLGSLLMTLFIAAGLLALALGTFDLNRYRGELQSHLSAALDRPVRLGRAELSLRYGPAVAFSDLAVGEPGNELLRAGRLLARLDWRNLLQGRIAFSRILLDRPHFHVLLTPEEKPFEWPDLADLESAEIRSFAIRSGTLRLEDRRDPRRPFSVLLEEIKAEMSGIAAGKSAWIRGGARLRTGEGTSVLTAAGEVTLPDGSRKGGDLRMKLGAILENFDPAPVLAHALARAESPLSGAGRWELTAEGGPSGGLRVQSRFAGPRLAARLPGSGAPLSVREIRGNGTWIRTAKGHALRAVSLKADDLALEGEIALRTDREDRWIEARFSTPPLPVPTLARLLPKKIRPPLAGGKVQIRDLVFAGPVAHIQETTAWGRYLSGEALLSDLAGKFPHAGTVSKLSARLLLKDDLLLLEEGKGEVMGTSVSFAGTLERPFAADREFLLEAEGAPPADRLLACLPPERRKDIAANGALPTVLGVSGRKERMQIDLQADLGPVAVAWRDDFRKPAGTSARFTLSGTVTPENAELSLARLQLPSVELLAHGSRKEGSPAGYALSLDLKASDLAAVRPLAPLLAELKAEGGVHARVELAGGGDRLRYKGSVMLREAGLHLGGIVADLHQANGLLHLSQDRIDIERLSARLGTSPISVEGHLAGFDDPRAELRVRARAMRADELIFTSSKAILRDLDGHLLIDGSHVAFAPVKVRLDGGTRATVKGDVRNFDRPHVGLDISADEADLDEVIALWDAPEGTSSTEPEEGEDVSVRITARAERGKLGPLRFQQATGVVTWEKGVLSVYPLQFRSGPGTCTGRVVVADRPGGYRLSVSGHAEKFDAASIYQELLERRGLVTGTLRGDFSLEGDLEDFSRTVKGGVNIEVEKGVLRKFNSLAKVFSLLNVSQIFSLQLPDMARDGMPFNRLAATFDLERGVLRTEDFFIDSNAMNLSLVGSLDLKAEKLDMLLGLKPLRTVDKIVTRIPLAGWLLTGEEKALITAHFQIRGPADDPEVRAVPITSLSEKAVGIFRRVLGLPGHLVDNVGEMVRRN